MRSRLHVVIGMLALVSPEARAQAPADSVDAEGRRGLTPFTPFTRFQSAEGVQVSIVVDSVGRAHVRERYRIPRDTGMLTLQLLRRACASVSAVTLSNYERAFVLAATVNEPWLSLRDTTTAGRAFNLDSSGFDISYTVTLVASSGDIPLVQLTRPIPRLEEEREGGVSLSVEGKADVIFPRLARAAPGQPWVGRFVAIPSFVRVERIAGASTLPADCAANGPDDTSDGGLAWRFWTLVGIMVAWVPIYLAWARRAQDGDA